MSWLDALAALLGLLVAGGAGWKLAKGRKPAPRSDAGEILIATGKRVKMVRGQGAEEIRKAEAGEGVGSLDEEIDRADKAVDRWRR